MTIWTKAFIALLAVNFLRMMGQAISNTVIPLYAYDLGAAASMIGFVSGCFAITALLIRPFAGPAFDSFSKTRLFFIFGVVLSLAGFAYAFVNSVEMIIVVRLIHGVGMGATAPLGMAIASDILPASRMNIGISIYSIAQSAALAVGPAFGVWLANTAGYFWTFIVTGTFLALCCIVVLVFVKEPPVKYRPPYKISLTRAFAPRAIGISAVQMLMTIAFSCSGAFLVIFGNLVDVPEVSLFFTVNAVCMLGTMPLFGRLADKIGSTKVIVPTMVIFALSYVLIAFSNSLTMFIVAAVVSAAGYGASSPLVQAAVFKCVPGSQRGSASNTSFTGMDLGNLIGPYVGGMVIEWLMPIAGSEVGAYSGMWLAMIVPIAAGMVLYLAMGKSMKRYAAEAEQIDRQQAAAIIEAE